MVKVYKSLILICEKRDKIQGHQTALVGIESLLIILTILKFCNNNYDVITYNEIAHTIFEVTYEDLEERT